MSRELDEQITKYEEWAARLEANIEDMTRQRKTSWLYLVAGVALGALAWRFHHFLGGAIITLGIILWSTALYITWMRIWYYRGELTRTRLEIHKLLETAEPGKPAS